MNDKPDPLLGRDEIYLGDPVKGDVAELILREGTLHLRDLLAAKIQFEHKAAVLMGAFTTLSVGLAGAAILGENLSTAAGLLISGLIFGVAAASCMWALRDQVYGIPGINPRDWLTEFWLKDTGKNATAAKAAAMMAHEIQEDIRVTSDRNEKKANLISAGIFLAIFATTIAMVSAGIELWG